jgi:hypothetical protein
MAPKPNNKPDAAVDAMQPVFDHYASCFTLDCAIEAFEVILPEYLVLRLVKGYLATNG